MKITSINPATGEAINTYDEATPEEVVSAVAQAHEVWQTWRMTTFAKRAMLMKKTAKILRERRTDLAMLMAAEMGKPLKQGTAEVEKCAWACEYYAENAEAHLAPDIIKTEGSKSYVAFEPLALCLRSCRGISRCGRSFGSPPPLSWPAMLACSSILRACQAAPRHRRDLHRGRLSQRRFPHVAYPQQASPSRDRASTRARSDAHWKHARGQGRGCASRCGC